MKILAIDPSVNNIGIAIYDTRTKKLQTYTLHPNSTSLIGKCIQAMVYCRLRMDGQIIDRLVAEYPTFQGSTKGKIAAQRGYTLDLAFIVGYISASIGLLSKDIHLPTPMQWKGTMPKEAVGHRFQKVYGIDYKSVTDHEFEAAMMIDWSLKAHPI